MNQTVTLIVNTANSEYHYELAEDLSLTALSEAMAEARKNHPSWTSMLLTIALVNGRRREPKLILVRQD